MMWASYDLNVQELDGVILVLDASHPEQEKDLEQFYMNFAQPYSLTIKQCLVVAVQAVKESAYGLGGWTGERMRQGMADGVWDFSMETMQTSSSARLHASYHARGVFHMSTWKMFTSVMWRFRYV